MDKNKNKAGILALLFGWLGIHRYYLNQRGLGITYMIFGILGIVTDTPFFLVTICLISFVDALLFFTQSKTEFDIKYNSTGNRRAKELKLQQEREEKYMKITKDKKRNPYFQKAELAFGNYDFNEAIVNFQKALQTDTNDKDIHYKLACCYSLTEKTKNAIFHLSKAIENGFTDIDKIHSDDALAYLRTQTEFQLFAGNGYQETKLLSESKETILDQLERLANLKALGILSEDEFNKEKQKILRK